MAKLIHLQGGEATPFELTEKETTLGRHPDCGVQLQSNMVSRHHARIVQNDGQFFVEDLGSGNGTFLNGQRIYERTLLKHNDRIKLGPVLLRFDSDADESSDSSGVMISGEFELTGDLDDRGTVMETVQNVSGFGLLEVRPEAKLKGIIEIARSLAGTVDVQTLLPKILETLFSIFPQADRGVILLKNQDTGQMYPAAQKHRRETEDATVKLSRTVLNKVLEEKMGILSADAATDERFEASESISALTIRSVMCVPLLGLDGEPMGVINIDTQNPLNRFTTDDLDLLLAVAGQAALSYENARLLVSHMEKLKQDNEMDIARSVQHSLLPETLPEVQGWEFFASYDSAQAVGGDYYDAIMLSRDKIALSFGDVAGKGVPAALLMSRMSSCVRNILAFVDDVRRAAEAINNHMCESGAQGRFVTYILVVIDLKSGQMSLVNAGHMTPLVRRADGRIEEFGRDAVGIPIGVMPNYSYEVSTRVIEPGEIVLIVTDGVDEAMNPQGELYTKERVVDFVKHGSPKADELGRALLADVRQHAAGRSQNDDITIMAFGRSAG